MTHGNFSTPEGLEFTPQADMFMEGIPMDVAVAPLPPIDAIPPETALGIERHIAAIGNDAVEQPAQVIDMGLSRRRFVGGLLKGLVASSVVGALAACTGGNKQSVPDANPNTGTGDTLNTADQKVEVKESPYPEMLPPEFRPGEKAEFAAATGWEGIANANLQVLERYNSPVSEIVIVKLDSANPTTEINELKAAVSAAEMVAARKPAYTARGISLGTGAPNDVPFQLELSGTALPGRERHVFIFTDSQQSAAKLIASEKPSSSGVTKRVPDQKINVSILPNIPGVGPEGLNLNVSNIVREAWRSSTSARLQPKFEEEFPNLDLSNLRNPKWAEPTLDQKKWILTTALEQMVSESEQYARVSRAANVPYAQYQKAALERRVITYAPLNVRCYAVADQEYEARSYPV